MDNVLTHRREVHFGLFRRFINVPFKLLSQTEGYMWFPIASIVVGLSLGGFSLFVDMYLCSSGILIVFCIGAALVLSGFGTQASGRWNNVTLAGAGALALLICGFVHMQEKSNPHCGHREAQVLPQVQSAYAQIVPQELDGWAYVGINFGQNWDEKYFTWNGDNERLPQKGDTLTATGAVNLRKDHIHFKKSEGWVNAEVLDVIRHGNKVKVLEHKTIADGFHWVKVKKVQ